MQKLVAVIFLFSFINTNAQYTAKNTMNADGRKAEFSAVQEKNSISNPANKAHKIFNGVILYFIFGLFFNKLS